MNPFHNINQRLDRIEKLLLALQQNELPTSSEPDKWFNIDELIEYLPDKPAKATIYGRVSDRKLPFHKTGKALMFRKSEIDAWICSGKNKTIDEIEHEVKKYLNGENKVNTSI